MSKQRYRLLLHHEAEKELRSLPGQVKQKAKKILASLQDHPVPQSASRLQGSRVAYRIRLQSYRLLYEVHASEIVVYVFGIAHRKEAYRRLLRRR